MTDTCAICIGDYSEVKSKVTLGCGHSFHYPCLLQWNISGTNSGQCPLCRDNLGIDGIIKEPSIEPFRPIAHSDNTSLNVIAIQSSLSQNQQIQGVSLRCNDCLSELEDCEMCYKLICKCQYNSQTVDQYPDHSSRCPFDCLDEESPKICSKCLHERDEPVMDFMNDDHGPFNDDIFSHERMHELYTLLYQDKSGRTPEQISDSEPPSMTWDEFIEYAQEMFDRENQILSDLRDADLLIDSSTHIDDIDNIDYFTIQEDIEIISNLINQN